MYNLHSQMFSRIVKMWTQSKQSKRLLSICVHRVLRAEGRQSTTNPIPSPFGQPPASTAAQQLAALRS